MKKITISLDDETYRLAHIYAAHRKTSVSAVMRRFLVETVAGEREFAQLKKDEAAIRAAIRSFKASDRLSRDESHARA